MTSGILSDLTKCGLPAAGVGMAIMVLSLLGLRYAATPPDRRRPILAMAAFIAVLVADLLLGTGDIAGPVAGDAWKLGVGLALLPLLPVSLWGYVDCLTRQGRAGPLGRHMVAPTVAAVGVLPYLALPGRAKVALVSGVFVQQDGLAFVILALVGCVLSWLIWIVMLAGYGWAIVRALRRHGRRMRDLYSNVEAVDLQWIYRLMAIIAVTAVAVLVEEVASLMMQKPLSMPLAGVTFGVVVVYVFGIFGLQQVGTLPLGGGPAEDMPEGEPARPSYARSGLDAEDCKRIVARLEARMEQDRLWRDPNLNLQELARKAGVKPIAVSQALNTHLGRNFFDYVNAWRIREACELLRGGDDSIVEVCERVGFNAKSTFNAAFRKVTGQTPSRYRASHQ